MADIAAVVLWGLAFTGVAAVIIAVAACVHFVRHLPKD